MGWSEIKHAINSSVGTENFKPLNEIVEGAFNTIVGEQNLMKQKLSTGENDFYVDRAKNVDVDGFVGALEEYRTARIAHGSYVGKGYTTEGDKYRVYEQSIILPFEPKLFIIRSVGEYSYSTTTGTAYALDYSATAVLTRIGETARAYFHATHIGEGVSIYDTYFPVYVKVSNDGKSFTWGENITFSSHDVDERLRKTLSVGGQTYYYTAIA